MNNRIVVHDQKVLRYFKVLPTKVQKSVKRNLQVVFGNVKRVIISRTPANTGKLQRGYKVSVQSGRAIRGNITNNVHYFRFIEEGNQAGHKWTYHANAGKYHGFYRTVGHPGIHMVSKTWREQKDRVYRLLAKTIKEVIHA